MAHYPRIIQVIPVELIEMGAVKTILYRGRK